MRYDDTFHLTRPARKAGGDRYESEPYGPKSEVFVIYIPQHISRPSENNNNPLENIKITFEA